MKTTLHNIRYIVLLSSSHSLSPYHTSPEAIFEALHVYIEKGVVIINLSLVGITGEY